MDKRTQTDRSAYFRADMMKRFEDLYHFFFLMLVAHMLSINPLYGGAVYITGLVWINYSEIYPKRFGRLEKGGKMAAAGAFGITAAVSAYLAFAYPLLYSVPDIWLLITAIALVLVKPALDKLAASQIYRLLLYLASVFAFLPFVVIFAPPKVHLAIPAGMVVGALITYAKNLSGAKTRHAAGKNVQKQGMRNINSYRLYSNMVVFATAAVQITVMMYVSYRRYTSKPDLVSNMFDTLFTVFLSIIIIAATISFLQKKIKLQHHEKTLIFVIAASAWVMTAINIYNTTPGTGVLAEIFNILLIVLASSFVFFVLAALRDDIKGVFYLAEGGIRENAVESRLRLLDRKSVFMAYFTVMLMLVSLCIDPRHQASVVEDPGVFGRVVIFYMLVVPALFLLAGIIYSVRQPLTRKYSEKLKRFRTGLAGGKRNPHLERQLVDVLVKKYKSRFGIKVIAFILYPLFRHKVEGKENVKDRDPAVFVCNHREIYGPVVTHLYLPYICRPWIISGMVEKEHIYDHLLNGYNVKNSKLPMFIKKAYCKLAGPVLIWAMNSVEPIPVYRGTGRGIIKTMKLTVEALEQEDNILLFPENNIKTERYTRLPGEFFTGFAHIGKEYFKKTGKCITFYPMYADSGRKVIFIGEGATYDPQNHPSREKERIVEHLKNRMDEMAANGKSIRSDHTDM